MDRPRVYYVDHPHDHDDDDDDGDDEKEDNKDICFFVVAKVQDPTLQSLPC